MFNLQVQQLSICQYNQYIYKNKYLMRETIRFCYVSHSMKRIEIPLSHIRDKNKFKSGDSLFPLIQCFKTFHLSHTQKTPCISIHHFHFYSYIYTCPQPFISSYLKYTQKKMISIQFQPFNDTYITPTVQMGCLVLA